MTQAPLSFAGNGQRALHLLALAQLSIAFPLYRVLLEFPEFLVAQQAGPVDILGLVLILSFVLPGLLVALYWTLSTVHAPLGRGFFVLAIVLMLWLTGLALPLDWPGPWAQVGLAGMFSLVMALAYFLTRPGRWFVHFLWPAIALVPAWFLANSEIRALLRPPAPTAEHAVQAAAAQTPIVFIVFDELPTVALLDEHGAINRDLFPNFHALAATSHWYPYATTVASSTVLALPAMVTGQRPDAFRMPNARQYRDNLFTWLGDSHELHVREAVSSLCPPRRCGPRRQRTVERDFADLLRDLGAIYLNIVARDWAPGLAPDVGQSWRDFWQTRDSRISMYEDRLRQMDGFIAQIQPTAKPRLDFLHANFPHVPYEYLPSGTRYPEGWLMPGLNPQSRVWDGTEEQSQRAYQRFLLQLQATDAWLGRLIRHLQDSGQFNGSMVVLTADHGVSFRPGASRRDVPTLDNLEAHILPVPLIIKAPAQTEGRTVEGNAETIDIVPTIAEILSQAPPWQMDGVSLLQAGARSPEKRARYSYRELREHVTDVASVAAGMRRAVAEGWFHTAGADEDLYRIGPQPQLLGRPVTEFEVIEAEGMQVQIDRAADYQAVDPASGILPAQLSGTLQWPDGAAPDLAITLNHRVEVVTGPTRSGKDWTFAAMLPEAAFRPGANAVDVYALAPAAVNGQAVLLAGSEDQDGAEFAWDRSGNQLLYDGRALIPDAEGIRGALDFIHAAGAAVEVMGWAIDTAHMQTVQTVLIFAETELVHASPTRMLRDETHDFGVVLELGFHALLPAGRLTGNDLVVIAVTRDGRYLRLVRPG